MFDILPPVCVWFGVAGSGTGPKNQRPTQATTIQTTNKSIASQFVFLFRVWAILMVSLWKGDGQNSRRIILLLLGFVFFRFLCGKDRASIIPITSGFRDVSLSPKTNIIHLLRPQDTSTNPRKSRTIFVNIILGNIRILKIIC